MLINLLKLLLLNVASPTPHQLKSEKDLTFCFHFDVAPRTSALSRHNGTQHSTVNHYILAKQGVDRLCNACLDTIYDSLSSLTKIPQPLNNS
jgi:hypothetical protein